MTRIFRPSKTDVWEKFAKEIGGVYSDGGSTENDILEYTYKEWKITLDTVEKSSEYRNRSTRMRAPFLHKNKLQLNIYAKGYLSRLLGINGISIGDEPFEKEFIVKGNNERTIKQLMEAEELIEFLKDHPYIKLKTIVGRNGWLGLSYPDEISILLLEYQDEVLERAVLRDLFQFFRILLDRLVEVDVASAKDPNFVV